MKFSESYTNTQIDKDLKKLKIIKNLTVFSMIQASCYTLYKGNLTDLAAYIVVSPIIVSMLYGCSNDIKELENEKKLRKNKVKSI